MAEPSALFEPLRAAPVSPELAPFLAPLRERLEIPERLGVSEWAERYRVFDSRTSATKRYELSKAPAMRAVMDALSSPIVRIVVLRGARQVGKTTTGENAVGTWIGNEEDRGPVLWVEAIEKNITRPTFRARIDSLFACETVREQRPRRSDDRGSYKIVMPGMIVLFAWAGSQAAQSGDAVRYAVLNEVGLYRKHTRIDAVSVVREALATYEAETTTKLLLCSTPEDEGDLLDLEMKASDRRYYHLPCPHCGGYQILVFKAEHAIVQKNVAEIGWTFPDPHYQTRPNDITPEGVYYKCIHCGETFDERHRLAMLARGVWAREGSELVTKRRAEISGGRFTGRVVPVPAEGAGPAEAGVPSEPERSFPSGRTDLYEPFTENVGFHYPHFICPRHPWWRSVRRFLAAVRSGDVAKLQNVVRFVFAEPWRVKGEAPKPNVVKKCRDPYKRGTIPAEAEVLRLFAGIDVQKRELYYVIRAFGFEWRSWLVDYGTIDRPGGQGTDLAPILDPILGKTFSDWAGDLYDIERAFIDAQWDTESVHEYCSRQPDRVSPARGGNREIAPAIIRGSFDMSGRREKRRRFADVTLYTVNPWRFSEALVAAMRKARGEYGEWRLPEDADDDYLAQVTNQGKGRSERGALVWKRIHPEVGDHYFDAEKLARAAAMNWGVQHRQRPGPKPPPSPPTPPIVTRRGFRRQY